jgi:hypothetical protein
MQPYHAGNIICGGEQVWGLGKFEDASIHSAAGERQSRET